MLSFLIIINLENKNRNKKQLYEYLQASNERNFSLDELDMAKKWKPERRNSMSLISSTKMSKQKLIKHGQIATVSYKVTDETRNHITNKLTLKENKVRDTCVRKVDPLTNGICTNRKWDTRNFLWFWDTNWGIRGIMVAVVGKWTQRSKFKSRKCLFAFHISLISLKKWIPSATRK